MKVKIDVLFAMLYEDNYYYYQRQDDHQNQYGDCDNGNDFCEEKFPNLGLVQIEDAESGERVIIDSANAYFREEYSNQRKEFQDRFVQRLKRRGIDFFSFSTDSDFVKVLIEFFQMRINRRIRY